MVVGLLGILGLLGNFRGKDGKLKKWGYGALCFIGISTAISISINAIEAKKEKDDALVQLSRMEGLLKELYRLGQPITHLEITFFVELPTTDKAVEGYITELKQAIVSRKKDPQRLSPRTQGLQITTGQDGELLKVQVNPESPYWPKNDKKMIGNVAKDFELKFYIRKDPIKPERFYPIISNLGEPGDSDWSAMNIPPNTKNTLYVDYKNKTVIIVGLTRYDKRFWVTNGKMRSIVDLYGSQIFLVPPQYFQLHEKFKAIENPSMNTFIGSLKIKTVVFSFAAGHHVWIDGAKFEKSVSRIAGPVFSIILPNNEKELLGLNSVQK